jgi:hypothetical protein
MLDASSLLIGFGRMLALSRRPPREVTARCPAKPSSKRQLYAGCGLAVPLQLSSTEAAAAGGQNLQASWRVMVTTSTSKTRCQQTETRQRSSVEKHYPAERRPADRLREV